MIEAFPHLEADPLHFFDPRSFSLLATLLASLLLAFIVWRMIRRRRQAPAPVERARRRSSPAKQPPFVEQIDLIEERVRSTGEYRAGCHQLADALRVHFAGSSRRPLDVWTAGDLRRHYGEQSVVRAFEEVAAAQFRRRKPDVERFTDLCSMTRSVAGERLRSPEASARRNNDGGEKADPEPVGAKESR